MSKTINCRRAYKITDPETHWECDISVKLKSEVIITIIATP